MGAVVSIVFPAWWRGGRWPVEELLADLFEFEENAAAVDLSGVRVEPFVTKDSDRGPHLAAGNGFLLVHRRGGSFDRERGVDESVVDLVGLTSTRHGSNLLMEYVSDVLSEFDPELGGGTVHRSPDYVHRSGLSTTFMTVPGEVVGPQLIPELLRDERFVPATWEIHADRPRGLPDYRGALSLDSE